MCSDLCPPHKLRHAPVNHIPAYLDFNPLQGMKYLRMNVRISAEASESARSPNLVLPVTLQGFVGTVFLPSNAALNNTLTFILELASNATGRTVTSLPPG